MVMAFLVSRCALLLASRVAKLALLGSMARKRIAVGTLVMCHRQIPVIVQWPGDALPIAARA
jgi:hypothetical protein